MSEQAMPPPQIQIPLWNWMFQPVAKTPLGETVLAILIQRPPIEQLAVMGTVSDLKRFHRDLGVALRQSESGLILPGGFPPVPPINGNGGPS